MADTKTMYLVELSGQGDHYRFLVSEKIIDWINSRVTPGREGDESCWSDTATPTEFGEEAHLTIGSYQNDRAMHLLGRACRADFLLGNDVREFLSVVEMVEWAKENDVAIDEDSGFEGYIY
jgi:hypothetical protein